MNNVQTMKTPELSKKDKVRRWAKTARNGTKWSTNSIATAARVSAKDVSNVLTDLMKGGCFDKRLKPGTKEFEYVVNSNAIALFFVKHENGITKQPPKVMPIPTSPKRKAARSPLVMAIDQEIHDLKDKIKRLEQVRKEFV